MGGMLREYRLSSVAIVSSLALLVTTIIPCACHAEEAPFQSQPEKSESHPCGSHGETHDSNQSQSPHESDSDCCCSIDSPRALFGSELLFAKAQVETVPLPDLLPPGASLGFPASLHSLNAHLLLELLWQAFITLYIGLTRDVTYFQTILRIVLPS
jgi:hypothetical protein